LNSLLTLLYCFKAFIAIEHGNHQRQLSQTQSGLSVSRNCATGDSLCRGEPNAKVIRLGIGDVTEPLPEACRTAMIQAVEEMGDRANFKGYGPEQGYAWLREKIAAHDFQSRGCDIDATEIFISDGSKCDCGNILDIFGSNNSIAVTDPCVSRVCGYERDGRAHGRGE
jgi:DNA-binding transcriptional MocR family regulator